MANNEHAAGPVILRCADFTLHASAQIGDHFLVKSGDCVLVDNNGGVESFGLVQRIVSVPHYELMLVVRWMERGVRRRELVLCDSLDVVPLSAVVSAVKVHMNRSTVPRTEKHSWACNRAVVGNDKTLRRLAAADTAAAGCSRHCAASSFCDTEADQRLLGRLREENVGGI